MEDENSTTPTLRTSPLLLPYEPRVFGGRYRVRGLLGRGGMADVFLGDDLLLERAVAIKLMRADVSQDPAGLERFRREATTLAAVRSTHVVGIYDIGLEHDGVYLVMQHVDGQTLEQEIVRSGPMGQARAESVLTQLLDGLAEMHSQGLVHRDIKPANILLDRTTNHVVLLDLGIVLDPRRAPLTEPGMVTGTPGYLAPESRSRAESEFASDVYQVGLLMLFLMTGVDSARRSPMEDFDDLVKQLPRSLGMVARRALATDPAERFPSAALMKEALASAREPEQCDTTRLSATHLANLLSEAMPPPVPSAAPTRNLKRTVLHVSQIVSDRPAHDEHGEAFSTSRPTKRLRPLIRHQARVKILLVDEDESFCGSVQRILSAAYDVAVVHSASQAIARLSQTRVDVILCGLSAPMELHEPLHETHPELTTAIIFLSSLRTSKVGRTYIARLPNQCLGKPFEVTFLKQMIDQCLASPLALVLQ